MRRAFLVAISSLCLFGFLTFPSEARSRRSYNSNDYGYGSTNPNSHWVNPSTDRNGSYRSGHFQTNPNGTDKDNAGTLGNINPWTGQSGTRRSRSPW